MKRQGGLGIWVPDNPSAAYRALNPHLYGGSSPAPAAAPASTTPAPKPAQRVRQRTAPKLNQLETRFQAWLHRQHPELARYVRAQAKTFVISNGVRYTPDFTCNRWPDATGQARDTAWEVKGPQQIQDDSSVKVKTAPTIWPEVRWLLVWEDAGGRWQEQELLPE